MGEVRKLTSAEIAKDKRLRSIYKMSLDEHNQKMESQKFKCPLCDRAFTGPKSFTAYQDHDHACCPRARGKSAVQNHCGKCNRGLLCYLCNKWAVGLVEKMEKQGIKFDRVMPYLKFWHDEIAAKGGYEPKAAPKRKTKKKRSPKK